MRKKRTDFEDDGHVIAPMDVDGMPQSMLEQSGWFGNPRRRRREEPVSRENEPPPVELTPSETRRFIGGALAAALLVAGVMIAAGALFILFCTHVWLR